MNRLIIIDYKIHKISVIAGNPNMSLPSSSKVNNILNNKFTKTIELVKEQVANNYLCLTADIWTLNLKSFISISAHWVSIILHVIP